MHAYAKGCLSLGKIFSGPDSKYFRLFHVTGLLIVILSEAYRNRSTPQPDGLDSAPLSAIGIEAKSSSGAQAEQGLESNSMYE